MRIEAVAKDGDGGTFYSGYSEAKEATTVSMMLDAMLSGDTVEVKVRDDNGLLLGEWAARNMYPADTLTATQFQDGIVTVTDNASNTYVKEKKGGFDS